MNTTTDLRETLARHAELHDHDLSGRTASVRGRIQVVRRRRRAALAGAAAAIVVAGVGLANLPTSDQDAAPATHLIGGVEAPHTLRSLGYTYTFVEGVEARPEDVTGEMVARGTVPNTGTPHLLSWGSEGDLDTRVFARVDEVPNLDAFGPDFGNWVLVPPGKELDFQVKGADVAVLYELSDPAPGVTGHGVTFRERSGSFDLGGALFGETGESLVRLPVEPALGQRASFARFCESSIPGAQFQVTMAGEFVLGGSCDGPTFDPGRIDNTSMVDPSAGSLVTMRLLPRGVDVATTDPAATLEDPEARLGVAFYQAAEPTVDVLGWDLEPTIDHGGRTWRYVRTVQSDDNDTVLIEAGPTPQLLSIVTGFRQNASLTIETALSTSETSISPDGVITGPVLWPDERQMTVRPWVGHPIAGDMAVAIYELAD